MIPKIIHYCWFGRNPKPQSVLSCIASWKKYLPDYEIKEWNEDNFDVNKITYTAEAYRSKKYAFVSDYARFWILYKYGGLYFDTDVEVIKNMDGIIAAGPFMGREPREEPAKPELVAPGLGLGASIGLPLYKEIIESYHHRHLFTWDGKLTQTVVEIVSEILTQKHKVIISKEIELIDGVYIYSSEYFCPKNYFTGLMNITDKTVSIHHYSATWVKTNKTILEKAKKRLRFIYYRLYGESFRWVARR